MKTKATIAIITILLSVNCLGQLKGSGKIISKMFDYRDFDKVDIKDLNGNVIIEAGKPWSIHVEIDDNLIGLLQVKTNPSEHQLEMSFKGNSNNKLYVEKTNIRIKITMPEVSVIRHNGNSNVEVKNISGRYFKLISSSNGNVKIQGTVDMLDIQHQGNGDVNAGNLAAKKADIDSDGNGDVIVNISEELIALVSGNGNIVNNGNAEFKKASRKTGNGKLINRNTKS